MYLIDMKKDKKILYAYLASAYCAFLIVSNILTSKPIEIFGINLTAGIIVFPIVYIMNDIFLKYMVLNKRPKLSC